jgi:CRISPR-associated protein Csm1
VEHPESKATISLSDRRLIYFAALFHDIGKVVQRSQRHLQQYHVPKMKHAYVGSIFLRGWRDKLGADFEVVQRLVENHHNNHHSMSLDEKLLKLSDWLSSGERVTDEDVEIEIPGDACLISIFSSLFEEEKSADKKYYQISELSLDSIFPEDSPKAAYGEYDALLDDFLKENVNVENFPLSEHLFGNPFLEKLYFLAEKYFWSIPAQTPSPAVQYSPDVSLFDHSRTTAAVAISLWYEIEAGAFTDSEVGQALDSLLESQFKFQRAQQKEILKKPPHIAYFRRPIRNTGIYLQRAL